MYADTVTDSMRRAIGETQRRRQLQLAYNAEHGIEPQTIRKAVNDILAHLRPAEGAPVPGDGRRRGRPGAAAARRADRPTAHRVGPPLSRRWRRRCTRPPPTALRVRGAVARRGQRAQARAAQGRCSTRSRPSSLLSPRARRRRRAAPRSAGGVGDAQGASGAGAPSRSSARWSRWCSPARRRRAAGARSSRGRPGRRPGGRRGPGHVDSAALRPASLAGLSS